MWGIQNFLKTIVIIAQAWLRQATGESDDLNQEFIRKDRWKEQLYYANLKRACKKVLNQLVYLGKKVVFNKPVDLINCEKMVFLLCDF